MRDRRLFLHAYVTATDYDAAFAAARDLTARLETTARIREIRIRPYHKFDDQFGVWLDLEADDLPAAFARAMDLLAEGWRAVGDEDTDRAVIWDRRWGGSSPVETARWLHLNLFERDDAPLP